MSGQKEEKSLALQMKEATKWLADMALIGNKHAEFIHRLTRATLVENSRITSCLTDNLAPLMRSTIGKSVAKSDIMAALAPISDLLGGPQPPVEKGN